MVDYVIETNNLSKIYSKNKVVNSVNMHVEKGKIYGLLGKNGAGKTTTMCMLLNLTYPSSGDIFLFGKNPAFFAVETGAFFLIGRIPAKNGNLSIFIV